MSDDQKSALDLEQEKAEAAAKEDNATRTGVGTRLFVGKTRGKSPVVIKYEAFDDSQPATLPTSIKQFAEVTGISDEPSLVERLWRGHNEISYTAASDPLKEFVNPSWSDEIQLQFRTVVRNYSRGAQVSLDEAVALIKPGFDKQFSASPKA